MIPEKFKRIVFALEDRIFDWRNNIDTQGVIAPGEVDAQGHEASKAHATAYQSVWCRNLRALIRAAQAVGKPEIFIDIGSGKGKACIYAARHFAQVIGVEYSAELLCSAKANLHRCGKHNIQFVQADAANYDVPDLQSLIFLFNPFDAVILGEFIARNLERIHLHGSLIAYANDLQREVLVEQGFECVFRDLFRQISLWRITL